MSAVGSPFWIAPEVIRGEIYDYRADIWSFGVVLGEILMHQDPYLSGTRFDYLKVADMEIHPILYEEWVTAPHALFQLAQTCCASNPADRMESMSAVLFALLEMKVEKDQEVTSSSFHHHSSFSLSPLVSPDYKAERKKKKRATYGGYSHV